jgi:hypothetical protein
MKWMMWGRRADAVDIWQDEGRGRVVGRKGKPQILVDLGMGVTGDILASNRYGIRDRGRGRGGHGMRRRRVGLEWVALYESKFPSQNPKRC